MMTDAEAINEAVRISGVERYRYLATEHEDPATRADYLLLCRSIATGEPIETPGPARQSAPAPNPGRVAALARAAVLVRQCPYLSKRGCGCNGYHCGLIQQAVPASQCLDCVSRYGL